MSRVPSSLMFVLPLLFLGSGTAVAKAPPTNTLVAKPIVTEELWLDFTFKGNKVGFLHAKDQATTLNGRPAIFVHRWSVVTVKRMEQLIRMESTIDAWFDPSGAPLRFKRSNREGDEVRSGEGYRDGDTFVVQMDVGGNQRTARLPLSSPAYLSLSLDSLVLHDLEVGKKLAGNAIMEEEGQIRPFSIKVSGKEKLDGHDVFVVDSEVAGIQSRMWVRPNGRTVKIDLPTLGAAFVETTPEKALVVNAPVDIFRSALFEAPEGLPEGPELDKLTIRLSSKSGKRPAFLSEGRQKAKKVTKSEVVLEISAERPPARAARRPVTDPKMKAFLAETPYEALNDERLVAKANELVHDTKDVWTAARRINRFVYSHIKTKSLARAYASASEALSKAEGDCTEHAVLFSALAKIAGIPTRLATGLVFVARSDVFGYHEWVEIWVGSRWVAMDPTFGQDLADPTHIKFAHGLSDADGLRQAGVVAASLIGDLKLKVVDYTTAGGKKKRL